MKYRIICEMGADLPKTIVQQNSQWLYVLPMNFTMNGIEYIDSVDNPPMSCADFYNALRTGAMASTSLINSETLMEQFRPILEAGEDILYLCFSSGLSGTYQAALIAQDELTKEYPQRKIIVVDSLMASLGQGMLVWLCLQRAKAGQSITEVADYADSIRHRICAWFTVDDLNFLKRGGRVSAATAIVGTVLGIKPILHVDEEGHLIVMEKCRGRLAAIKRLAQKAVEHMDKSTGQLFISHGDCLEDAQKLRDILMAEITPKEEIIIGEIGSVIGSHSGPGTLALFYIGDKR